MRFRAKPILLTVALLAAAAVMIVCTALLWFKSNQGLAWVQLRVNAAIPGTLSIERHRLSLLKPALDLYGVTLYDPNGEALAGFARLHAALAWRPLLEREIRLNAVILDAPWADLDVHPTRGLNLMSAVVPPDRAPQPEAAPGSEALAVNLILESLQLTQGRLTVTAAGSAARLEVGAITLFADGDLVAQRGGLELTLDDVRFSSPGIRPEPGRIELQARLEAGRLHLPRLTAASGETTVTLSGSADDLIGTPVLSGALSIDSQLAGLPAIFNLDHDYAGTVKARLTLEGTLANPELDLLCSLEDGRIAGRPVDRGDLAIQLRDRQLRIDHAAVRLADGVADLKGTVDLRQAFPAGLLAAPQDLNALVYALTLVQDIPDLTPWLEPLVPISGAMTGRAALTGRGITPSELSAEISVDGSLKNVLAPGMDRSINADVAVAAGIEQGRIALEHLEAAADGFDLTADAHFGIHDRSLGGRLSVTVEDLFRVLAIAGISSVHGAGTAALTVGGTLNQPQFSIDLIAGGLKVDAYTLGDLALQAVMDPDGRVSVHHLGLSNRDSQIRGSGGLRLLADGAGVDLDFDNRLDLTLESVSAADFMAAPPVHGAFDGRLRIDGPLGSLHGELALDGGGIDLAGTTLGDIGARLRFKDGRLFVDRLDLINRQSSFSAGGHIQLLAPGSHQLIQDPPVEVSLDSVHFDPGDFVDGVQGAFSLSGELSGSVANPHGRLTITADNVDLAGQHIEHLGLDVHYRDQRLWLDQLSVMLAPGESIQAGGWIDTDKAIDLHLQSDGISVSRIQALDERLPGAGTLRLSATAGGRFDNPDIQGRLTISDIHIKDEAITDIDLTVTLNDMLARVTGHLNFEMDARYDLKKGDFDLRLLFDRTQTADYFKAAGLADLNGTLTGRVQAAGNIRDPVNAAVDIDLEALDLYFKETTLLQSDRMVLQLTDGKLAIPEFELAILSAGSMRIQGEAGLDQRINLTLDGSIPLAAAAAFSDELGDITGFVNLTASISGHMANPQIDARIDLEKIGMAIPGLVQRLDDLNGRIRLTSDTVHIETLNGSMGTGSFSLSGSVRHEQPALQRVDLTLTARSLPLSIPDTLELLLNGDLAISGDPHAIDARGELILLEGLYYQDVNISLLQMATTRQRAVAPERRSLSIPFADTVNLDIIIRYRQPFLVHNNLAYLEISPDLRIGGTLDNPIISGRAQVRSGSVTFQRTTFNVNKGVIDFVNPYRTEAAIDIESQTTIRSWAIRLAIKGTPDNLDLQLSSVPQESASDILALILFGRTGRELAGGSTGAQRTTGQIMAEMIADTFGEDLKKTTGIDILEVDANGDGEGAEGIQVTVGKRLSDRMTVKYSVGSRDSGEVVQRAITEYKLLENILVSGFQDSRGIYGSEMVFRIEFR